MAAKTLPVEIPKTTKDLMVKPHGVPAKLAKELAEIVEATEGKPEIMEWFHFVPCAGVRYYTYHRSPSPVEPLVNRAA